MCILHTTELPLRHLIIDHDGPILSNSKFSGPIGKLLDNVTEFEIDPNFSPINVGPSLIKLNDEVVKDLSTDQHYGYLIASAIIKGEVPPKLALLEPGPVNLSRWNTTASRICILYVSKHGLKGKNLKALKLIT